MEIYEINDNIEECIRKVITFAKDSCINSFEGEIKIIKHYVTINKKNSIINDKLVKYKLLKKRKFIAINSLSKYIYLNKKINWVDLTLLYANDREIIILVDLVNSKYNESLNFHCGFMVPPEYVDKKTKFDINWWLNTV